MLEAVVENYALAGLPLPNLIPCADFAALRDNEPHVTRQARIGRPCAYPTATARIVRLTAVLQHMLVEALLDKTGKTVSHKI